MHRKKKPHGNRRFRILSYRQADDIFLRDGGALSQNRCLSSSISFFSWINYFYTYICIIANTCFSLLLFLFLFLPMFRTKVRSVYLIFNLLRPRHVFV